VLDLIGLAYGVGQMQIYLQSGGVPNHSAACPIGQLIHRVGRFDCDVMQPNTLDEQQRLPETSSRYANRQP